MYVTTALFNLFNILLGYSFDTGRCPYHFMDFSGLIPVTYRQDSPGGGKGRKESSKEYAAQTPVMLISRAGIMGELSLLVFLGFLLSLQPSLQVDGENRKTER